MTSYNVGSQTTLTSGASPGILVKIEDAASNTYAYLAFKSFKAHWAYKVEQEYVGGTNNPYLITQAFSGDLELQAMYSTEFTASNEQLANFLNLTNGAVPFLSVVWKAQDTSSGPNVRIFTATNLVVPNDYMFQIPGEKTVTNTLKFVLSGPPVIS
jgi:hypothetical protein